MRSNVVLALDHLVYAVHDLDEGVDRIAALLGVRAVPGGRHPAWGTWNALLSLGPRSYLEIVAPDPDADIKGPRPLGVDDPRAPFLATWAATTDDIDHAAATASRAGLELGAVRSGQRRRADGVLLAWRLTDPAAPRHHGLVPFLIDWGTTPHPAATAPTGCTLLAFKGAHPEANELGLLLERAGIDLPLEVAQSPALIATIEGPKGIVELR